VSPKLSFAVVIGLCAFSAQTALAQKTDLASVKCVDFIKTPEPEALNIVTWLQGYYTYEDDQAVVDSDKVKLKEGQIKEYCADHGDTDLISVSAIFMDKKYGATTASSSTISH
jgi:hypothetical protein